jgi:hypothetical protein
MQLALGGAGIRPGRGADGDELSRADQGGLAVLPQASSSTLSGLDAVIAPTLRPLSIARRKVLTATIKTPRADP